MTNISNKKTSGADYELALSEISKFIGKLKADNASYFVTELLSDAESIMIVKRFAAILMFNNKLSSYRASTVLGMSLSTAQRLYTQYEEGRYNKMLECLKPKEKSRFMSLIEDLIMAQVSPRARARLYNRVL